MIFEQKEISFEGKVIFRRIVSSTDIKRFPKFDSENEACFMFLSKGTFQLRTPTNLISFEEGEALLAKCGNYFFEPDQISPSSDEKTISALIAFFYPSIIKSLFETDLSLHNFKSDFDTTKINVQPLLVSFIQSINFLLDNPEVVNEDLINTKLKEILLILSKSENSGSVNEFVHSLFTPHEYDFTEIIRKNLYSNLSLPELAHLCNISLATFKRKFSEIYNQSPAKYIQLKRLEKAREFLKATGKPVSEIAYECGFDNVSGFNRAFRRMYSCSPSEYRLSQKDKD